MNELFLNELKEKFGITFKNLAFLQEAFTHSSYVNEHRDCKIQDNERIEFLGDAVLELTVSRYLFDHYPELPEGKLTKLRATIVCEASLSLFAKEYGFDKYIRLGRGEERMNGRNRPALLCDLYESFIGALYLDQGIEAVLDFLRQTMFPKIATGAFSHVMDHKTNLQEWLQQDGEIIIEYRLIDEVGPAHEKEFIVEVSAKGKVLGSGSGKTKKAAEQSAAENALKTIQSR
ncbi:MULTISPECIES: ribonuclease III [Carnobacterium]|uniref:Ribonuclease 3 n=2 Tax=Carnobacterium divergens TaxID=2748 RepID=A0A0R2HPM0_CARDV|nr:MULTISPECIES: ribonuclease III [Carnobacterium]AOA00057.1 ribonuclease III [Carnobacterium divergens]KRN54430.1 Ribonuclease (RNase III) [Carnobacterium divergens DSM 20623]MCO6017660.1 ribonuclease III [Carnobacterium divergens]MDO0873918.1 ribonuclease III [Carnobacterium divergens]MDT1938973.1 ribonuclease III [Carnobacterium divergens]